mmetsp:Transcript_16710/g.25110  ORF Transcript_16710/g.25110 Transcript_16710/m.25110 type:complete len:223 (-) Transcript_16710:1686-2354(-)
MLEADWGAAKAQYEAADVRIQEKELENFTQNYAVVAKLSSFFAMIAYSVLTMTPKWTNTAKNSQARRFFLYTFLAIAISFHMLAMVVSSWCMIFGPSLAIRGPPGAMIRAVRGLQQEEVFTHTTFALGMIFLVLAAVMLAFVKLQFVVAVTVAILLLFWLSITLQWFLTRSRRTFSIDNKKDYTTGNEEDDENYKNKRRNKNKNFSNTQVQRTLRDLESPSS